MIIVQKFGGTSVKDDESRKKVLEKITKSVDEGNKVAVVVSAMGRSPMPYATDSLINIVKEKTKSTSKKELDLLMSCGETISAVLMSSLLKDLGYKAEAMTGMSAGIITDENFSEAKVISVDSDRLKKMLDEGIIPVITGFQGVTRNRDVTTLGRGGSDTTASIIGKAIEADVIEIYTDVNGIMTADPRVCENAKKIDSLPYEELFQMADSGAKVIHKEAAFIAKDANIELKIKNTFTDEEGTTINSKVEKKNLFTGIASLDGRVKVTVETEGFKDIGMFDDFADAKVSLDMINIFPTENIFTIQNDCIDRVEKILNKRKMRFTLEKDCSKVTVIGEMTGIPGVMNAILKSIAKQNIKVYQTVDSLVSISVLVKTEDVKNVLCELHKDLGL